ncbi:hypothetical protein KTD31_00280 [Burkholderia multivorans]|uniref:hypothetical protein n=1 Tax=Burkholderia multivorans TaxID=87883 RepID=UPI001C2105B3|nr:hypothetical protein [Burkholderia multivorans]MBU9199835.1 hypothetical protein [Burkholderia multivorans]MDN8079046.1 hypothetical protein [Burkholderia multivorans]
MSQSAQEQLEQAKQRLERANARRTQIQVKLESARQQYAEAVKEAQAAHGTADLDALRKTLVSLESENTTAVAAFVRAVDDFETFITRIEEALANPEAMNELLLTMQPAVPAPAVADAAPKAAVAFNEDDI